jgi:hypothetical protein
MKFLSLLGISLLTISSVCAMQADKVTREKHRDDETIEITFEQDRKSESKSYIISKIKDANTKAASWTGAVSNIQPDNILHTEIYLPTMMPEANARVMYYALKAEFKQQNK